MALDCEARMDHLQREPSVDGTDVNTQQASSKYKIRMSRKLSEIKRTKICRNGRCPELPVF